MSDTNFIAFVLENNVTIEFVEIQLHSKPYHSLQWHHNECDGVSNHRRLDYLLNLLFSRRSKKPSELHVIESTGDQWIPLTKGQQRRKWRHHAYKVNIIPVDELVTISDVIMSVMASHITSLMTVYSTGICRSKKTSKLHVTGLCEWNSSVTSEFTEQRASNVEMFPFDDVIMIISAGDGGWSLWC